MSMEASIATWELTKSQITPREKFLLLSLARRAGEDHTCWPSIKRMAEDTGFDRKTIIDTRQLLIEKKLISYTGRMVGRNNQIPEMKLLYVDKWEQKRNSPRLKDEDDSVDNLSVSNFTSTKTGTGTSTSFGTGTSTENGTLNSKEEYKRRNKSFCVSRQQQKAENQKKPDWAEVKKSPLANVERQSTSYSQERMMKISPVSNLLAEYMKRSEQKDLKSFKHYPQKALASQNMTYAQT